MALRDVLVEVTTLKRAVDDQIRLIRDFRKANNENILLVRSELRGGTKGYEQRMLLSLEAAEKSLDASAAALERATTALTRVQAI